MQRKTLISITLVILILIAGFVFLAFQRGALRFGSGKTFPTFSWALFVHPKPALDTPVTFPSHFDAAAQEVYNRNLQTVKAALAEDESNMTAWNDLAIYRKMVGDIKGAEDVWQYMLAIQPGNGITLHNLAELYFHESKDYAHAEKYYMRSIAAVPTLATNYTDLFDLYRYIHKDNDAAIAIMKQGMVDTDVRQQVDMGRMLADFYVETGDTESAIEVLTEARRLAEGLGNKELVRHLDERIAELR